MTGRSRTCVVVVVATRRASVTLTVPFTYALNTLPPRTTTAGTVWLSEQQGHTIRRVGRRRPPRKPASQTRGGGGDGGGGDDEGEDDDGDDVEIVVSTPAGSGVGGLADDVGAAAMFHEPEGIALGPDGNEPFDCAILHHTLVEIRRRARSRVADRALTGTVPRAFGCVLARAASLAADRGLTDGGARESDRASTHGGARKSNEGRHSSPSAA